MKGPAINRVALISLVAVVACIAWFRSARPNATPGASLSDPTVTVAAARAQEKPAQKGDVCPDPPPTATQPTTRPTTAPASAPASAPAPVKLPRVVDLGADKCKACKDLAPILEQLKKEYAGRVTVEFIDVWKTPRPPSPTRSRSSRRRSSSIRTAKRSGGTSASCPRRISSRNSKSWASSKCWTSGPKTSPS